MIESQEEAAAVACSECRAVLSGREQMVSKPLRTAMALI